MTATFGYENLLARMQRRQCAEQQVAQKYSRPMRESSGWYRAINNRLRKS